MMSGEKGGVEWMVGVKGWKVGLWEEGVWG